MSVIAVIPARFGSSRYPGKPLLKATGKFLIEHVVESSWAIIDGIEQGWQQGLSPLARYEPGTWGPVEADALLAQDGRLWDALGSHDRDGTPK